MGAATRPTSSIPTATLGALGAAAGAASGEVADAERDGRRHRGIWGERSHASLMLPVVDPRASSNEYGLAPTCDRGRHHLRFALLARHHLGWRCVAGVLRQWLHVTWGTAPRRKP